MPEREKAVPARIYIGAEQHRRLTQLAEAEDRSISSLIRRAIDEYLKHHIPTEET